MARDACAALVLHGAACVDEGDAAAFADLFPVDGVLVRPNGAPLVGRTAIRDAYALRSADRLTRHVVTNQRVILDSTDRARVQSLVTLWGGSAVDTAGPQGRPTTSAQVLGEFDDLLSLTPDGWRIARREARFLFHTT
ncbi:MAG: nuclear transport factor 2 family protein, partial [Aquabacterium sp.]